MGRAERLTQRDKEGEKKWERETESESNLIKFQAIKQSFLLTKRKNKFGNKISAAERSLIKRFEAFGN